jgi:hypothetical protein
MTQLSVVALFIGFLTAISHFIFNHMGYMHIHDHQTFHMLPFVYAVYNIFNNLIINSDVIELPKHVKNKFESPLFKYFVLYMTVFIFVRNPILTMFIVIGIALFVQYLRSPLERKQHPYLL